MALGNVAHRAPNGPERRVGCAPKATSQGCARARRLLVRLGLCRPGVHSRGGAPGPIGLIFGRALWGHAVTDTICAAAARAPAGAPPVPGGSRRILVTGAGGLIGRELVGALAARGHGVVALLHRSTALRRNDGSPIRSASWDGAPPVPGAVATLSGDVRRPGLGLEAGCQAALAGSMDLVVHCAAVTGFNLDLEAYRAVNVEGTANVLDFAGRSAPSALPVLYVSTAYVCGERSGPIAEGELDAGQGFANGYEASKAEAERLVGEAGRRGRVVAVARPSIVVGASDSGMIGDFSNIYALIRLVAEGRIRVLPTRPGASLDLVPIDHVIGGLIDLAERIEAAAGRTYHLVSGAPVPVAGLRGLALAYPQLHAPRFVPPEAFDPTGLSPLEQLLNLQVTALYAGYLQRNPCFLDDNLRALSGRACPRTDEAFLRRMLDHCLATGFVKPRVLRPEAARQRTSG